MAEPEPFPSVELADYNTVPPTPPTPQDLDALSSAGGSLSPSMSATTQNTSLRTYVDWHRLPKLAQAGARGLTRAPSASHPLRGTCPFPRAARALPSLHAPRPRTSLDVHPHAPFPCCPSTPATARSYLPRGPRYLAAPPRVALVLPPLLPAPANLTPPLRTPPAHTKTGKPRRKTGSTPPPRKTSPRPTPAARARPSRSAGRARRMAWTQRRPR